MIGLTCWVLCFPLCFFSWAFPEIPGRNKSLTNKKIHVIIKKKEKGLIKMIEFGIMNVKTEEEKVMFGYNIADAYRRAKLDMNEWHITYCEYID